MGIPIETIKALNLRPNLYGVLCSVDEKGQLVPYNPDSEPELNQLLKEKPDPEEAAIVYPEPLPLSEVLPVEEADSIPMETLEPRVNDWHKKYADSGWRGIKDAVEQIEQKTGEPFDRGHQSWGEAIDDIIIWEQLLLEQGLL